MRTSYKAFTLFEILLAMLLMAIIAISVLPGITKNAEQQVFVTQLKVVQNDLKQAMLILSAKNRGSLARIFTNPIYTTGNALYPTKDAPTDPDTERNFIFAHAIRSVLSADCVYFVNNTLPDTKNNKTDPQTQAQAFANRNPHFMDQAKTLLYGQNCNNGVCTQPANFAAINLKSGATVRPIIFDPVPAGSSNFCPNNLCGALEVDLNGTKKPNVVGKDIHFFWIVNTDDGIVPWGEDAGNANPVYDKAVNVNNAININQQPTCTLNGRTFDNVQSSLGCTYNVLRDGKITYY